jgi:hypothetical protein
MPIALSLGVIFSVLLVSILLSIRADDRDRQAGVLPPKDAVDEVEDSTS